MEDLKYIYNNKRQIIRIERGDHCGYIVWKGKELNTDFCNCVLKIITVLRGVNGPTFLQPLSMCVYPKTNENLLCNLMNKGGYTLYLNTPITEKLSLDSFKSQGILSKNINIASCCFDGEWSRDGSKSSLLFNPEKNPYIFYVINNRLYYKNGIKGTSKLILDNCNINSISMIHNPYVVSENNQTGYTGLIAFFSTSDNKIYYINRTYNEENQKEWQLKFNEIHTNVSDINTIQTHYIWGKQQIGLFISGFDSSEWITFSFIGDNKKLQKIDSVSQEPCLSGNIICKNDTIIKGFINPEDRHLYFSGGILKDSLAKVSLSLPVKDTKIADSAYLSDFKLFHFYNDDKAYGYIVDETSGSQLFIYD